MGEVLLRQIDVMEIALEARGWWKIRGFGGKRQARTEDVKTGEEKASD
jgi:hypothetical protein